MLDLAARDLIVAPVTPPGAGGVAIVRLSGPGARDAITLLITPAEQARWSRQDARSLHLFELRHPATGIPLDRALVVWFPEGSSFTGEEVVEVQCHGATVVVDSLVLACQLAGARLAEPGEFTFRAFRSGRIDLTAAEGIFALTQAQSSAGQAGALQLLEGGLKARIDTLRLQLTDLMAQLEVTFDYPEDIAAGYDHASIVMVIQQQLAQLDPLLADFAQQQIRVEGLRVVLIGAPNAGKSSLLNALLGDQRALVHAAPGTTRDVIEASLLLDGQRLRLFDTAGRREDAAEVEAQGIALSNRYLAEAHLVLHILDASHPLPPIDLSLMSLLVVLNKHDLPEHPSVTQWATDTTLPFVRASALQSGGVDALKSQLQSMARALAGSGSDEIYLTQRQFGLLTETRESLAAARELAASMQPEDLVALHLREALTALLSITGEVYDETVLQAIFSQFCVGK